MWVTKVDVVFIFEGFFSSDIVKASILGHIFRKGSLVVEPRTVLTGNIGMDIACSNQWPDFDLFHLCLFDITNNSC